MCLDVVQSALLVDRRTMMAPTAALVMVLKWEELGRNVEVGRKVAHAGEVESSIESTWLKVTYRDETGAE